MSETPREVFAALLEDEPFERPSMRERVAIEGGDLRAAWLARFDAAEASRREVLPLGITEREAAFVGARDDFQEAMRTGAVRFHPPEKMREMEDGETVGYFTPPPVRHEIAALRRQKAAVHAIAGDDWCEGCSSYHPAATPCAAAQR